MNRVWIAGLIAAVGAASAVPIATNIGYADAKPILSKLPADLLPAALRGLTSLQLKAEWPKWVSSRDRAIRARIDRGDHDSIVNFLLFGVTFTKQRRIHALTNISNALGTRAGLQPHRFDRSMRSDDPDFEPKAADVIGLYLNPPQHAAVFAADEKTAIQALDRLDPVLPLSPGRAERHGFEYVRHGTLSLFAALNTQTGEVLGHTVPRHTSDAFVAFLGDIVASQPAGVRFTSFSTTCRRTRRAR